MFNFNLRKKMIVRFLIVLIIIDTICIIREVSAYKKSPYQWGFYWWFQHNLCDFTRLVLTMHYIIIATLIILWIIYGFNMVNFNT